uniref:Uncharacterized protein n=1 Tax=viral metagenome TaxID=1070528 RepID=A0A6C0AUS3_9ZZZZ
MATTPPDAPRAHRGAVDGVDSDVREDVLRRVYAAVARAPVAHDAAATAPPSSEPQPEDVAALRDVVERAQHRAQAASSAVTRASTELEALRGGADGTYSHPIRVSAVVARQCAHCLDGVVEEQLSAVRRAAERVARSSAAWLRRLQQVHASEMQDMRAYAAELQDRATQLYDTEDGAGAGGAAPPSGDAASVAALPGASQHAAGVYAQFLLAMRNTQADHVATARDAAKQVESQVLDAQAHAVQTACDVTEQAARDLRGDVRAAAQRVMTHMAAAQSSGAATYAHVDVAAAWRRMMYAAGAVSDAMLRLRGMFEAEFALTVVRAPPSPR